MMRVLIIMHSSNTVYGAAKSLQKLIRYSDWDIDIVYPNSLFHPVEKEIINNYSFGKAKSIYRLFLPFRHKPVFEDFHYSAKDLLWETGKRILEVFDRIKLKKIIKNGKYDYILLNSIVLYPIIEKKNNTIVYMRDFVYEKGKRLKRIINKLENAKKIIFIDKAITIPFRNTDLSYQVINNPFDMMDVNKLNREGVLLKYNLDKDKVVVSIVGAVAEDKGIDFVVQAFNQLKRDDVYLLVVGSGNSDYVNECKHIATHNNIVFLGEIKDITEIYCMTDYILRADCVFATGRTVYEGLFSGCEIIMQIEEHSDVNDISQYNDYKEKFHFYKVRNSASLVNELSKVHKVNKGASPGKTNINRYIQQINDYIN